LTRTQAFDWADSGRVKCSRDIPSIICLTATVPWIRSVNIVIKIVAETGKSFRIKNNTVKLNSTHMSVSLKKTKTQNQQTL
jgi:hypothetical protein